MTHTNILLNEYAGLWTCDIYIGLEVIPTYFRTDDALFKAYRNTERHSIVIAFKLASQFNILFHESCRKADRSRYKRERK